VRSCILIRAIGLHSETNLGCVDSQQSSLTANYAISGQCAWTAVL